MKNEHIKLMEQVVQYLQLHNRALYTSFNLMLSEIKEEKIKRNKYKLEKITEKRKIDPSYGGHNKKKVSKNNEKKDSTQS